MAYLIHYNQNHDPETGKFSSRNGSSKPKGINRPKYMNPNGNKQRTKFFAALKNKGYGAVLDTNDAAYNAMHARSPVIVFDMENVVPKNVRHTYFNEKRISGLVYTASKLMNK